MDQKDRTGILKHLREVASKAGIDIFQGDVRGKGGTCRIKNRWIIVLNRDNSIEENIDYLCYCLSRHDTESIYILPAARERIAFYRKKAGSGFDLICEGGK
jgi:hypothetical protein